MMPCANCSNLKIKKFTYTELLKKWNKIYAPCNITPGYERRMIREAIRNNMSMEETSLKFIFCCQGILQRFYIVRGNNINNKKIGVDNCQFYT
jgi:hypothetical protein